ncbi:MAG: helix-turn-helix domain-containing protein [Parvibaculum sp.]|uniref:helix-turn-helix domain-containing protein n=1 Tax=Parvibaculum sp. TaxID=2024848 RepID=UPI003C767D5C
MSTNLVRLGTSSNARFARHVWPVIPGGSTKPAVPPCEEFVALRDFGARMSFGRNATIFSEGEAAKYCYMIVSGSARLCKLLADGRRQITEFLLPGDFLGLSDIETYAISAETISNVVVLRYLRSQVEFLSEEDAQLRRSLGLLLRRRLGASQAHLVLLGRHTVRERIASFLIQMDERLGADPDHVGEIDLPMGRLDIADYLGLTIETVCRTISELKRAGVIDLPNTHRIAIRQLATLRDLADGGELMSA